MKTKKCGICSKRFRLHDWQEGIEKEACMTCLSFCKYLLHGGGRTLKENLMDLLETAAYPRDYKE